MVSPSDIAIKLVRSLRISNNKTSFHFEPVLNPVDEDKNAESRTVLLINKAIQKLQHGYLVCLPVKPFEILLNLRKSGNF